MCNNDEYFSEDVRTLPPLDHFVSARFLSCLLLLLYFFLPGLGCLFWRDSIDKAYPKADSSMYLGHRAIRTCRSRQGDRRGRVSNIAYLSISLSTWSRVTGLEGTAIWYI